MVTPGTTRCLLLLAALSLAWTACERLGTTEITRRVATLEIASVDAAASGMFAEALRLERKALDEARRLGRRSPTYIHTLGFLAQYHVGAYEYSTAESLLTEAVECAAAARDTTNLALTRSLLGSVFLNTADYDAAESTLKSALNLQDSAPHVKPQVWLTTRMQLCSASFARGDLRSASGWIASTDSALSAYDDLLAHASLSAGARDTATVDLLVARIQLISQRAELMHQSGRPDSALSLLAEADAMNMQVGNAQLQAMLLINIIAALDALHRYGEADELIEATGLAEDAMLVRSPMGLGQLYSHYAMKGDTGRLVSIGRRWGEVNEQVLERAFVGLSERRMLLYLAEQQHFIDMMVTSAVSTGKASRTADSLQDCVMRVVVQRKDRAAGTLSGWVAAAQREGGIQARDVLRSLLGARHEIVIWSMSEQTNESADSLSKYAAIAQLAEQQLAQLVPKTTRTLKTVTPTDIANGLPRGAAALEIVGYYPARFREADIARRWGARHYAGCLITRSGVQKWVGLGPAEELDALAESLRVRVQNVAAWQKQARALRVALLDRVGLPRKGIRRLTIAPDGDLNLVPFGLLELTRDAPDLLRAAISYSGTIAALGRRRFDVAPTSSPVVIGDPDFDGSPGEVARRGESVPLAAGWSSLYFKRLPGTQVECNAVASLVPGSRVLLGSTATKGALERVRSPRILHVATHGVFLGDSLPSVVAPSERYYIAAYTGVRHLAEDNPLLRSGLALAGANHQNSRAKAILTALEISGMDLSGTELVVLSACDTGVGPTGAGQGVFGLRRALAAAGASGEIMSLWAVDDTATCVLMAVTYLNMKAGLAPGTALHSAQDAMRRGKIGSVLLEHNRELSRVIAFAGGQSNLRPKRWQHPYYWGAFVYSQN